MIFWHTNEMFLGEKDQANLLLLQIFIQEKASSVIIYGEKYKQEVQKSEEQHLKAQINAEYDRKQLFRGMNGSPSSVPTKTQETAQAEQSKNRAINKIVCKP